VANEYATLAELKAMRSIATAVTSQDDALQRALTRASRAIDRRCGRRFYRDGVTSARTYSPRGRTVFRSAEELLLTDDIATSAGLSATIGGVTAENLSYSPENAEARGEAITGLLRSSWYGGDIVITAEWGWPAVPDSIQEATLLLANRRYMRKDSPEGVSGWSQEGQIQVSRFDPDIEDLISPFVIEGFGA
jgi:hypothetical protein